MPRGGASEACPDTALTTRSSMRRRAPARSPRRTYSTASESTIWYQSRVRTLWSGTRAATAGRSSPRRSRNSACSRPMHRRRDEAAVWQVVHGVQEDATLFGFRPDVRVRAAVVGCGDRDEGTVQVTPSIGAPPQLDRPRRREVLELPREVR